MGKASSNKKVARAAGISGGRSHRRQTPWTYYGVIGLILVLGVVGTVTSRDRRLSQINKAGTVAPPTVGTTWHEGYEVYECGKWITAISVKSADPDGIDTRVAGVITVAPTKDSVAGKNATLGKFSGAVGMKLNAAEIQVPGGKLWQDGDSCEGSPGHVYVMQFPFVGDSTGQLYNGAKGQLPKLDPRDVPFTDQALITIAFVPANKAASIPAPQTYVQNALKTFAASSTTTTTVPSLSTGTTVPSKTTATTAPAKSSSTTTATTTATTVPQTSTSKP